MSGAIDNLAKTLQAAMSDRDKRKTSSYDGTAQVLSVDGDTLWVRIPGGEDRTPVQRTIDASEGDNIVIRIANHKAYAVGNTTAPPSRELALQAYNNSITATQAISETNEFIDNNSRIVNSQLENVKAKNAEIENVAIQNARITNSFIDGLTAEGSEIRNSKIEGFTVIDGVVQGFQADRAEVFGTLTAHEAVIDSLDTNYAHITNGTIDNAKIDQADVNNLSTNYAHITNGTIDNAKIGHADVNGLNANYAHITQGVIDNAKIGHADVNGLNANYAHISNGTIDNAKIGYADVNDLNAHYAGIDLANVNNAWIQNGVIKNGAIADAQIIGVSANKLTAGIIDASNITVTNLNADNITTGTINGQRIGSGSLSLDKLSEEVPTKQYLDNVAENLQGQIDGQIETWTGTVVPTLQNSPAVNWGNSSEKHKHVGDIYYVVNAANEADGYTYRFTESGTAPNVTYSWTLIKDNQITKALQDILDMQGDISGIQTFDTQISSWKIDTDSELSSLKSRTSTLETDMGTKVSTTTFNELSQTVDENSASITSLGEEIDTKADGSTVRTLSNTVNTIQQTTNSNSSTISQLTTTLGTNADGTTKANDVMHRTSAIEQDLSGFKTTVSSTYSKVEDLISGKTNYYLLTTSGNSVENAKRHDIDVKSGSIINTTDAVPAPAKSFKVTLDPIQDLNGYDKPWSGGAGKNKVDYPNISAPATANTWLNDLTMPSGNYVLSFDLSNVQRTNTSVTSVVRLVYSDDSDYYFDTSEIKRVSDDQTMQNGTYPLSGRYYVKVANKSIKAIGFLWRSDSYMTLTSGSVANIMLESGTTPSSYEPYSNICPISGRTEAVTQRTGKNLFPQAEVNLGKPNARTANVYLTLKAGTYMVSYTRGGTYTGTSFGIQAFKDAKRVGSVNATGVLEVSEEADHLYFYLPASAYNNNETVSFSDIQLELGSTATDYEAFDGNTYTTSLGRTVYGGTLDVVSGELVVDRAIVTLNGTESWVWEQNNNQAYITKNDMARLADYRGSLICDSFETIRDAYISARDFPIGVTGYADASSYPNQNWLYLRNSGWASKADFVSWLTSNPVTVCYELAEPQTYQLTPQEVSLLLGQNNVWSDGNAELIYLVERNAEWSTEKQTPTDYNPYVWWKWTEEFSNSEDAYESDPVIFNSIPEGLETTYAKKAEIEVLDDRITSEVSFVEQNTKQYADGAVSFATTHLETLIDQSTESIFIGAIKQAISNNYNYALTTDTTVNSGKTYYINDNDSGNWIAVENPVDADISSYYERGTIINENEKSVIASTLIESFINVAPDQITIAAEKIKFTNSTNFDAAVDASISSYKESVAADLEGKVNERDENSSMTWSNGELTILANSASEAYATKIGGNGIEFQYGESENELQTVASINQDQLVINKTVVLNQMNVGRNSETNNGLWSWVYDDLDRGIYLKWIG